MFSKKATKIDESTWNLTLCSKCQIHGEDFVNFRGLLSKYELSKLNRSIFHNPTFSGEFSLNFQLYLGTDMQILMSKIFKKLSRY